MSEWIKCSERMPDDGEYKLVARWFGFKAIVDMARYGTAESLRLYGEGPGWWHGASQLPNVTHWMPLPEPPKED